MLLLFHSRSLHIADTPFSSKKKEQKVFELEWVIRFFYGARAKYGYTAQFELGASPESRIKVHNTGWKTDK